MPAFSRMLVLAIASLWTLGGIVAQAQVPSIGTAIASPYNHAAGAVANLTRDDFDEGKRKAPGLLEAAKVNCSVSQAAHVGTATISDATGRGVGQVYEVACTDGLGYLLITQRNHPPAAFDCIAAAQSGKAACMLTDNHHPAKSLEPYLQRVGAICSPVRARFLGEDTPEKTRRYEVECDEGGGYLVDLPLKDGDGPEPLATDCLQTPSICTFTPHVESVAMLAHRVGVAVSADCNISDARYVGYVEAAKTDLYELSCQIGHDGMLVQLDTSGLRNVQSCSRVKLVGVGVGCQLKPSDNIDPLIRHAQTATSTPVQVQHPDWEQKPNGDDFVSFYPDRARMNLIAGQATMTCRTTSSGLLADCFIADESPGGYGFGDAALKMSSKFRIKQGTEDGVPVAGEHVTIPIDFGFAQR